MAEYGGNTVATLKKLGKEPSAPLSSALGMEHHHPMLIMMGGNGGRIEI